MKILQLCKKFPYPLKDGESIAVTYLSKALNELGCDITLLSFNTKKHYCDIKSLPDSFNHYEAIHPIDLDNELKLKDAFLNLFSKDSYHISRFVCDKFKRQLIRLLKKNKFDVVQLETPIMAPYIDIIRQHSRALVVMRTHNVEHEIWGRIAENSRFWPKKLYLQNCTTKLKRYEIEQLQNYDLMAAITQRDLNIFKRLGYKKASLVTPIGLDIRDYIPDATCFHKKDLSFSFIGSLDWMPNQEGLEWFLNDVWKQVNKELPTIKLEVAGRRMPDRFLNWKQKNVGILGEIPDAIKFINQHPIMIVPLLSGSGMRVKILEGMALGKVIITTSIGLEGINARHKKEVLIADTEQEFIECIKFCYNNRKAIQDIGHRAQVFTAREYDNLEIAKRLLHAYRVKLDKKLPRIKKELLSRDAL